MKKTMVSVVATAALSTIFVAEASANTYKVERGDSLWLIANQYNTQVSKLKEWNNLTSDLIYPNQILQIGGNTGSQPKPETSKPSTSAKTYTVKSGDTLIGIANAHNITLGELKSWNNISSYLIYPGQKFIVSKGSSSTPVENNPAPPPEPSPSATSYTVKPGDTLSGIGLQFGVSVRELKQWNSLKSDLIYIGQKLSVKKGSSTPNGSTPEVTTPDEGTTSGNVITEAKKHMGVPYAWGGSSPAGFDCSGFIYYVFNKAGKSITRTSSEGYYSRSFYVNSPKPGDLVFFENTYKRGISHMGIYLGGGQFIHAGNNGVEISSLSNSYWKSKFDGYKRFY
jgi:peptidoglycan DL-endopeptidase LytE